MGSWVGIEPSHDSTIKTLAMMEARSLVSSPRPKIKWSRIDSTLNPRRHGGNFFLYIKNINRYCILRDWTQKASMFENRRARCQRLKCGEPSSQVT